MLVLLLATALAAGPPDAPEPGIPETLARERADIISQLRYDLAFTIPTARSAAVEGRGVIRFALKSPHRIVLDFADAAQRIRELRIGGRVVQAQIAADHVVIPATQTRAGDNEIVVIFTAGDESLNRNDEFLYTLFVPARAHFAFPCFDQPDLKARYTLSLDIPAEWVAVANGAETGHVAESGRRRLTFAETQPLPTYLFAFTAGRFSVETAVRDGRELRMLHRENDAAKVARNRDAIFDLHAAALSWLESYTGVPYAFGKFDFVLIPSFQFGGMEHAGAITYNAESLLLELSATQNQLLNRATVISHETAHMWFGDLVTMRWFNDVWMKEVFANFMAEKIVNPSFPELNHELRFFLGNYPSAYAVDRTAGANPIRQPLANLNEAGQLYGPIIYQKAPIVMRQLELLLGEAPFRDGLRDYLKRYAFANATWAELIRLLDQRTRADLQTWSRDWVDQRGRPVITSNLQVGGDGRVARLVLRTADPLGRRLRWPQAIHVTLGYAESARTVAVDVDDETVRVRQAEGLPRPVYVLPGAEGLGYGLFVLDDGTRQYLLEHIDDIPDALTRAVAWVTLWENLLEGGVDARAFLDTAVRALPRESEEQNTQRVLSYTTRAFWRLLRADERSARAPALEAVLRDAMARAGTTSQKAAWFSAFRNVVLTTGGLAWLERIWKREERIAGLTLAEQDEIAMALDLAVREVPDWQQVLQTQLERTQNPDRKARFAFVMPALSADPDVREQAFDRFRDVQNRRREPWVLESLAYLNHPLREEHARQFVRPGLELLPEIQRTGDIFFPFRWSESLLSGHRSPEIAAEVRTFISSRPQFPERLRWTLLSTADELFRAAAPPAAPTASR